MKLNLEALKARELWQEAGFALPSYDVEAVRRRTREAPAWLHFGAGNLFRMFMARVQDELLDRGLADTGVIIAETLNVEKLDVMYGCYDNFTTVVTLKGDGSVALRVIGCIAEGLKVATDLPDWARISEIFASPSLQLVSFTITEKGYSLTLPDGSFRPEIQAEFSDPSLSPRHGMGLLTLLLYKRFLAGAHPISLVSMDNVSHNGTLLRQAVLAYARHWCDAGYLRAAFYDYVSDEARCAFPWSMIDKITPAADPAVAALLEARGYEDTACPVQNGRKRPPSFSNAEETEYLVIEDRFPNGRPAWDQGGVFFTSRSVVDAVETMKVTTCLNPLHTALAVFGCLLGYEKINEEMKDADLVNLIYGVGYREGLPVVTDPGILNPRDFLDTVVRERFPNPFLPDKPQRIATDTSQKVGIRFGVTLRSQLERNPGAAEDLIFIPTVLAGWFRYLMGVDDRGEKMTISPDPLLPVLEERLRGLRFGDNSRAEEVLTPLLHNAKVFGLDLVDAGLAERILSAFKAMNAAPGAVREQLQGLPRV